MVEGDGGDEGGWVGRREEGEWGWDWVEALKERGGSRRGSACEWRVGWGLVEALAWDEEWRGVRALAGVKPCRLGRGDGLRGQAHAAAATAAEASDRLCLPPPARAALATWRETDCVAGQSHAGHGAVGMWCGVCVCMWGVCV